MAAPQNQTCPCCLGVGRLFSTEVGHSGWVTVIEICPCPAGDRFRHQAPAAEGKERERT